MEILPAIDLIDGRCVRLVQGRYDRQINYEDNPVRQALEFVAAGAKWLHIIDLDGARTGRCVNIETVKAITEQVDIKIELGGGIRDEKSIEQMLDIGIARLILGTSAVKNFEWFTRMTLKFPGRLAAGLDAKGSSLAVEGWTEQGQHTVLDFAAKAADLPIAAIIYTDITKDGMLAGPNLERTKALAEAVTIPVIAAGGVTTIEDVGRLKAIGIAGAVIGRAIYEGTINLADAVKAARSY